MSAVASGALEVAQHLFYYGELRAVHALLFRHGVLHMNRQNFVLSSGVTQTVPFPKDGGAKATNTHQATWVLFRQWVRSPQAAAFFGTSIRMRGETLDRWAQERPNGASLATALGPLMEQWGMDIDRFSRDRELRNQLSYSPTRMDQISTGLNPALVTSLFQQTWLLLEPDASNAFESIDKFIARQAFDLFVAQAPSNRVSPGADMDEGASSSGPLPSEYAEWVSRVLGTGGTQFTLDFLERPSEQPDPPVIALAGKDLTASALSEQIVGMIGRSLILLRFATSAVRDLIAAAGCSARDVDFWLADMLRIHGLRLPGDEPRDYLGLYDDVGDLLDDLAPLATVADADEMVLVGENYAREIQLLSAFERVPAWAVA